MKKAHLVQATKRKCVGQDNGMKLHEIVSSGSSARCVTMDGSVRIPLKG